MGWTRTTVTVDASMRYLLDKTVYTAHAVTPAIVNAIPDVGPSFPGWKTTSTTPVSATAANPATS